MPDILKFSASKVSSKGRNMKYSIVLKKFILDQMITEINMKLPMFRNSYVLFISDYF